MRLDFGHLKVRLSRATFFGLLRNHLRGGGGGGGGGVGFPNDYSSNILTQ